MHHLIAKLMRRIIPDEQDDAPTPEPGGRVYFERERVIERLRRALELHRHMVLYRDPPTPQTERLYFEAMQLPQPRREGS